MSRFSTGNRACENEAVARANFTGAAGDFPSAAVTREVFRTKFGREASPRPGPGPGNEGSVGMIGFAMTEPNLERIYAHPQGMVASDGGAYAVIGPARRGMPHPRGAGSFPRVLARYVRERGVLTLEQAVHKMTGLPASRVRLTDRGVLRAGAFADVTVFDPDRVADRADFASTGE